MKKQTSMTMDAAVLQEARSLGVNVSKAAEQGVVDAIRQARAAIWREENAGAIDAYNRMIETQGVPLGTLRKF